MSGLEAFLICDIDDEIPLNKIFPLYYNDQSNLSDLLIIAQNFKKCGKGCLQHKNKIFDPYYSTKNSDKTVTQSRGLGMTQIKNALALMNYYFGFASEQPSDGTAFYIQF